MSPLLTLCLDCGNLTSEGRTRCRKCESRRKRERNRTDYYQSREWRRLRRRAKQGRSACDVCDATERLIAHHGTGRQEGGEDSLSNLQAILCVSCHSRYEADKRAGKDTELVRIVEAIAHAR